jgi:hypothetical protein
MTSLGCGDPFVWFHFDAELKPIGRPWRMPDQSYTLDARTDTIWALRTTSPMRPVAVVGYRSH